MKYKRPVLVAAAAVVAAAAFIGPDLVDYHRFGTALDKQALASQANGGRWPQFPETCFACHGPRGQSRNAEYPALAGQPAAFIEAQLHAFASGQRDSPTMGPLARNLTDEQIGLLAAYYARQAPTGSPDVTASAALEARGKAVVQARSCQACHAEGLTGKDLAPRLAGQGESYLGQQLAAFKSGKRHDASGAMDSIAASLSNEDSKGSRQDARVRQETGMRGYTPSWLTAGVAAVLMLCMAAAMGVAPRSACQDPGAPRRLEALQLPDVRDQLEKLADAGATYFHEEPMRRGDTIATLLKRLGVEDPDAQQFISRDPAARTLFNLQADQVVQAEVDQDKLLVSLRAPVAGNATASRELLIRRTGGFQKPAFKANLQAVRNELRHEMRSGTIAASGFYRTMDAAHVPDDIVRQMISIFSGVVDFQHDIVQGDRFRIVYEAGFRDGALARNGRVVAVELVNRAQLYQALWYGGADGGNSGAYYTFDGRGLARPFLRSPVEFSRLSSNFGWRIHPVHRQWVQHKGVDYAAPTGTRVFATADGTVDFVGQQTGYGNIVILKHPDGYSTYYAHLSGFAGIQPGQRITQGQLIAYVGQTGWATGPHLHYELRFNDVPQNPLSVMLMEPVTLTGRARQGFLSQASEMLSRIHVLRGIEVTSTLG